MFLFMFVLNYYDDYWYFVLAVVITFLLFLKKGKKRKGKRGAMLDLVLYSYVYEK